jgi:integrase/recombinase XerD
MPPTHTSTTTSTTKQRRSKPRTGQRLKIIQDQLGHEHASTTALYTCVSSDFRTRTLRRVLDSTIDDALSSSDQEDT